MPRIGAGEAVQLGIESRIGVDGDGVQGILVGEQTFILFLGDFFGDDNDAVVGGEGGVAVDGVHLEVLIIGCNVLLDIGEIDCSETLPPTIAGGHQPDTAQHCEDNDCFLHILYV